jgi:hypothetical protein
LDIPHLTEKGYNVETPRSSRDEKMLVKAST